LQTVVLGLAAATAGAAAPAAAGRSGTIGLIGDSLLAATHADEMCGAGKEIPDCLDEKFGKQDRGWSHGGGSPSWSLAARLGYTPAQIVNTAEDGARWEGAIRQAERFDPTTLTAVFINLGANDVCQAVGHDYSGDLDRIAGHIDTTLSHLVGILPRGGRIFWAGVPDIVGFRNAMASRRHNYIFRSCQALWDLDSDEITEEAAASLCRAAGDADRVCETIADWQVIRDRLMERLLAYYREHYDIEAGPCGRILNSTNTEEDLLEAQKFTRQLNRLLATKAAQYHGVNGIRVVYKNTLYKTPISPTDVSRLDCFHPNRVGQMKMAEILWKAFTPQRAGQYAVWYEEFDNSDGCTQPFGLPWASCWYDYGDSGFDIRVDGEGWLRVQKDTSKQRRHFVGRDVGDLSGMTAAWMSFNHKRENLDDGGDRVYFKVYSNGDWHELDRFQGGGNDAGEHAGRYYDLTPYLSSDLRILFETENQGSMKDGDRVKFDNISIFAWGDPPP
jgi:lysophospholipase L1-like esterase